MTAPLTEAVVCRRTARRLGACLACLAATLACGPAPSSVRLGETTLVTGVAQPSSERQSGRSLSRVAALLGRASLLRLDRTCRARPGLAEAVTPSANGLHWTIELREGLRFHDGTPIDGEAVAGLLQPVEDDTFRHPGLRDISDATATGPRTVRLALRAPSALLQEALASLEVVGGTSGTEGAGPFFAPEAARGEGLELRAFDGYYQGRPGIDRLVLRSYPTARTAWAALMRREIDFLYEVSPEATGFVSSSHDAQVRTFLRSFVYAVGFNVNHPALRSAETRRRLSASLNRRHVIDHVFGGRGVAATDPVWPMHWAHDEPLPGADDAPAPVEAPEQAAIAPVPSAAPRLALRCLVPAGVPLFERLALHVQRAMLDVDVDLRLEPVSLAELSRRLAAGDFDTYLLELNGFGLAWTYWLWHSEASRPFVASGYRAADDVLDAMRRAANDGDLRTRLRAVRDRLREDPPAIFLCWPLTARAVTTAYALPGSDERDILTSLPRWQAVARER